tara:strand:+ start:55 stop:825 length:771 start_codon:yes stop_codon:yes gene_type:complete
MDFKNVSFFFGMAGAMSMSAVAGHLVNKYSTKYIQERNERLRMLENQKKFEYKYMDEFMATERNELTDEQRKELLTKHIRLEIEQGEIVMFYNHELESFAWYCNTKEVPYKYLETVARKYVIDNNCSCIYAVMHEELKKGRERQAKAKKEQADKLDKKDDSNSSSSSVFASFKTYNKKNADDMMKNKNWLIRENANRYSYKGKLEDYEKYIETRKESDTCDAVHVTKTMNFAQFKKERKTKSQPTSPSSTLSHDTV